MNTLESCYASLILIMLAGSRWLGNRLSGWTAPADGKRFLWRGTGCPMRCCGHCSVEPGAFVAAAISVNASMTIRAIAWNAALLLSMGYAVQGLGIASFIFTRWKMPRTLKFLVAATVAFSLVTPTIGIIVAVLIPVLGVTEVWIPYRNPKGVGA